MWSTSESAVIPYISNYIYCAAFLPCFLIGGGGGGGGEGIKVTSLAGGANNKTRNAMEAKTPHTQHRWLHHLTARAVTPPAPHAHEARLCVTGVWLGSDEWVHTPHSRPRFSMRPSSKLYRNWLRHPRGLWSRPYASLLLNSPLKSRTVSAHGKICEKFEYRGQDYGSNIALKHAHKHQMRPAPGKQSVRTQFDQLKKKTHCHKHSELKRNTAWYNSSCPCGYKLTAIFLAPGGWGVINKDRD